MSLSHKTPAVAFVNPPSIPYRTIMRAFDCATESKGNYLYQPYDQLLMSARVPTQWRVDLIDAIAERIEFEETLSRLRALAPDIVCLSLADTNWVQDRDFLARVRAELPGAILLACGDFFQEPLLCSEVEPLADGIIDNSVTIDFSAIWARAGRGLYGPDRPEGLRGDGTSPHDLKRPREVRLGIPRHAIFLNRRYRWPFARHFAYTTIFTQWGCPYSCSYCSISRFPNLWRPADDVLAEMEYVKRLGLREIYVGDRSFGLPRANALAILRGMVERRFGFSWFSYFHPNQYDPELLELMAASGCHTIIIGIESTNIENLKRFHRRVKPTRLDRLLSHARRLGVEICADFIIGLPGDDVGDIEDTIRLSQRLDIQYASFNIASPAPGSSLRTAALADGRLGAADHQYDSLGRLHVLGNETLDGETIRQLRNKAVRGFYLRPRYLVSRLLALRTWQQLAIQIEEAAYLVLKAS